MKYIALVHDQKFEIELAEDGSVRVNGENRPISWQQFGHSPRLSLLADGHSHDVLMHRDNGRWEVTVGNERHEVQVLDTLAWRVAQATKAGQSAENGANLTSPMPGMVIRLLVEPGAAVQKGDKVLILESMKMENELRAPCGGQVKSIAVQPGTPVEKGQLLLVIGA
jgi:biotin carboxyl carrier protein